MYSPINPSYILPLVAVLSTTALTQVAQVPPIFDWSTLQPSSDLNWSPCYDKFTCTRFEVPLDYDDKSAGTTDLAFIKWTSPNESAEDILFNPGGPGGSGIFNFLYILPSYLQWLGSSHNFVAFDPRGVNNSGIGLSCFPGQKANANLWTSQLSRTVELDSDESFAASFYNEQAYGKWCSDALKKTTMKYANTVAVSHDMLNYVETSAKKAGKDPKAANVNFFGISYGTLLGMTFATLFPSRVGRMILDGVTDADEYYAGTWYQATSDTDDALRHFFHACYSAGPAACAFHANSAQAIEVRFNDLLNGLSRHPIPVTSRELFQVPLTVTVAELRSQIIQTLIGPRTLFKHFANVLKDLEQRNGTLLAIDIGLTDVNANFTQNHYFDYNFAEPTKQIRCLDSANRYKIDTIQKYREHIAYMKTVSSYTGTRDDLAAIYCTSLNIVPPRNQQFPAKLPDKVRTKNPILFTSSRLDPVTPLRSAHKMSRHFMDSVVLIQETVGHGTISQLNVNCTGKYVQAYLGRGVLPTANSTCGGVGNEFFAPEAIP